MGLPQGFSLSPIIYNIYTKGLVDLNSNGLNWVFPLADDGLIYKTASDINTAVTAVQEQLEKVSNWCQETVQNQSNQGARPVVHPQQQSSRTDNASSLL